MIEDRLSSTLPPSVTGFRVALAIASLPGMTFELDCEVWFQDTSVDARHF
jgi:hypothetical protein